MRIRVILEATLFIATAVILAPFNGLDVLARVAMRQIAFLGLGKRNRRRLIRLLRADQKLPPAAEDLLVIYLQSPFLGLAANLSEDILRRNKLEEHCRRVGIDQRCIDTVRQHALLSIAKGLSAYSFVLLSTTGLKLRQRRLLVVVARLRYRIDELQQRLDQAGSNIAKRLSTLIMIRRVKHKLRNTRKKCNKNRMDWRRYIVDYIQ